MLRNDYDYERFLEKIFNVWEGNNHVMVWYQHIYRLHCHDYGWYYFVDCIVLEHIGLEVILLNNRHNMNMCVYFGPLNLIWLYIFMLDFLMCFKYSMTFLIISTKSDLVSLYCFAIGGWFCEGIWKYGEGFGCKDWFRCAYLKTFHLHFKIACFTLDKVN